MKRILYFTFYFEPDLCAGSFRNSPLVKSLSSVVGDNVEIEVITTQPNRYQTFKAQAEHYEEIGNIKIHRISLPEHKSGFQDQIRSFHTYYSKALKIAAKTKADLVFASSSRLFTAFLGYRVARKLRTPLYLDIRDIFIETISDVVKNPVIRAGFLPILHYVEKRVFSKATHINLISPGFKSYFSKYSSPNYSFFTNGIDQLFVDAFSTEIKKDLAELPQILYAGNIGDSQGLHILIPQLATLLRGKFRITIIGDGGAKERLVKELDSREIENVELLKPVKRDELIKHYQQADYFLIHLNDYDAFKRVLPSKVFELGASNKPILAGVGGYSRQFLEQQVNNVLLFDPGDAQDLAKQLEDYTYKEEDRDEFVKKYLRSNINDALAKSIFSYLR